MKKYLLILVCTTLTSLFLLNPTIHQEAFSQSGFKGFHDKHYDLLTIPFDTCSTPFDTCSTSFSVNFDTRDVLLLNLIEDNKATLKEFSANFNKGIYFISTSALAYGTLNTINLLFRGTIINSVSDSVKKAINSIPAILQQYLKDLNNALKNGHKKTKTI